MSLVGFGLDSGIEVSASASRGLGANALFGWWWADPMAALTIAAIAAWMARVTWNAESLEDTCCS